MNGALVFQFYSLAYPSYFVDFIGAVISTTSFYKH
jgi:hypothetical protein